jgi:uncharacterized membrane protein YgdD (TMEM256/DUF423 family)
VIEVVVCKTGMERHDRALPAKVACAGGRLRLVDCFDRCETCEKVLLARLDGMMVRFGSGDEVAGAFGAHGLEGTVPPARLETWETAARYHLVHAVALLFLAGRPGRWAFRLMTAGIAVFSGSLYALVLLDLPRLGAVTPVGGLMLIAGWSTIVLRPRPDG